ncbi:hypothetical protein [Pedobacter endophyticus]|uniref:DUF1579 domain-containing protein n=1 Tax=Pedobacter endophyticus TaxID=2789740 RepID=A0A7S9PZD5_9SPHI|nr:hypothetical protein [Pedobacter endophyticus]QPH39532.1 hypothetical protein IZT61_21245 [Pedobacter endophyticus]
MKSEKLKLLAPYTGVWTTEGKTVDGHIISGTDTYEWLPGGSFLTHKVDVTIGKDEIKLLEIIYYDDLEDVFRSQSFDNHGNIAVSTLKIIDDIILIFSERERFQGHFKKGSIDGVWEQFTRGSWCSSMNIKLTKQGT